MHFHRDMIFITRLSLEAEDTSGLEAENLSKKGRLLLLFKTTSKKRQKSDVEDRELLRMHLELIMLIQAIQFRVVQRPG